MIAKLLTILGLIVGQPKDELPYGVVYIPPAKEGKGAKVVIVKELFPNPLDKVPIIEPPEFFFPPIEDDTPVTEVQDSFKLEIEDYFPAFVVISAP